ncbi:MAG: restriction endonuclease [Elusimicrobia bacterium]|nr:restriction endonuclease [Candidatus Liberimonas magnetica]
MSKIKQGLDILIKMGIPRAQQNERSSLTLLAVLNIKERSPWSSAKKRLIRIHDILGFIEYNYKKKYAENTRETIRRQTLQQLEQAGIVERNSDDPSRLTNSPNTVYNITNEALEAIRKYNDPLFERALHRFISEKGRLIDKYDRRKAQNQIKLVVPDGKTINFSPGEHNELQIKIIKQLLPRFCVNAELVYVGDTANKLLFIKDELLKDLNVPITNHDKLPDIVLYDRAKKHLFLIEAVTSHGPISPKRHVELEKILKDCKTVKIYISAFLSSREFKRHFDNIAWETEVWIAENPDHMIHFNGPNFFTAY